MENILTTNDGFEINILKCFKRNFKRPSRRTPKIISIQKIKISNIKSSISLIQRLFEDFVKIIHSNRRLKRKK